MGSPSFLNEAGGPDACFAMLLRCAPPVRATDLTIPTWVMETCARNCDKFFGQVVVSNSPDWLGSTRARGGCDLCTLAPGVSLLGWARPVRAGYIPYLAWVNFT